MSNADLHKMTKTELQDEVERLENEIKFTKDVMELLNKYDKIMARLTAQRAREQRMFS